MSQPKENASGSKVAPSEDGKRGAVIQYLEKRGTQLNRALDNRVSSEHWLRVALTCINSDPKLLSCTLPSLYESCLEAAQLGLVLDGILGEAYLVPFKNKQGTMLATMIPGYKGLLKLARRSGEIRKIECRPVYAGDRFSFTYGSNPTIDHAPIEHSKRGQLTHAYGMAWLKNGETQFEVLTVEEIMDIRNGSQGYRAAVKYKFPSPWIDHFVAMARKTAARALCKWLPLGEDVQRGIAREEAYEAAREPEYEVRDEERPSISLDQLAVAPTPPEVIEREEAHADRKAEARGKKKATKKAKASKKAETKEPEPEPQEEPWRDGENIGYLSENEQGSPLDDNEEVAQDEEPDSVGPITSAQLKRITALCKANSSLVQAGGVAMRRLYGVQRSGDLDEREAADLISLLEEGPEAVEQAIANLAAAEG